MQEIHLSEVQKMLAKPDHVSLSVWTKKGEIMHIKECVPLRYNFYSGTRTVKLLPSNEIRTVRDVCIFRFNDMDVFL